LPSGLNATLCTGSVWPVSGTPIGWPGYRRFTLAMLEENALSSHRNHWFSMGHLKSTYHVLLVAAHRETDEYKIPH
jgi:hypothetical protein